MITPKNWIILCAFRYCLGRQTYIVSQCTEYLEKNWDNIEVYVQETIQQEIESAIVSGNAGHSHIDIPLWRKVLNLRIG